MATASPIRAGWFTPFLMVACVALAAVVVVQVRTNRSLRTDIAGLRADLEKTAAELLTARGTKPLAVGDAIEDLKLQDEKGMWNPRSFVTSGRSTLMLIASHGCEACAATAPVWETILAGPHPNCDAILVYIDGPPTPNDEHSFLPVGRYFVHKGRDTSLGRLTMIPSTVLIGPDGVIDHVWYGVIDPDMMREISDVIADAGRSPE